MTIAPTVYIVRRLLDTTTASAPLVLSRRYSTSGSRLKRWAEALPPRKRLGLILHAPRIRGFGSRSGEPFVGVS